MQPGKDALLSLVLFFIFGPLDAGPGPSAGRLPQIADAPKCRDSLLPPPRDRDTSRSGPSFQLTYSGIGPEGGRQVSHRLPIAFIFFSFIF
jgi:hypothetical protein